MNLTFDTETTGVINYKLPLTHASQPRIVQLGAQLADDNGFVKGELNVLIKPDGWAIPADATAIHGISTEDCERFGIPIRSALGMFNLWLALKPVLVAHNIDFDVSLVHIEAGKLGKGNILDGFTKFCTMKNSTDLVRIPGPRGFKWPKLIETYRFLFNEDFEGAHDAIADVRACARVYNRLVKPIAVVPDPEPQLRQNTDELGNPTKGVPVHAR